MKPDLFLRMRLRLAGWFAGAVALLLLAFALGANGVLARALDQQLDTSNQEASIGLLAALGSRDGKVLISADFVDEARETGTTRGVVWLEVLDASGARLAWGPPGKLGLSAPFVGQAPAASQVRWLRVPVRAGDRAVGTLALAQDRRAADAVLGRFARGIAIAIPLSLAIALVIGYLLSGLAAKPVRVAFEQQRRFIADASHELRTPLTILQTQAELALTEPAATVAKLQGRLGVMARTIVRMGRLVDDLLYLSRVDAAVATLQPRTFCLDELLEDVVAELADLASSGGVALRLQGAEHAVMLQADPDRIRRLLVNLVENGVKYAGRGGQVLVDLLPPESDTVRVAVRDSGPGVAPGDLPRIFERFYRADEARSGETPGTGLGLAIARAIAENHGGKLSARNGPGGGATFELELPLEGVEHATGL